MVSLPICQASNSYVAKALPAGLVAVFVGGTNGIGETTLKQFAKHTRSPRVYFVGRSQEAGARIAAVCKTLNSEGEYYFMKADTSLIRVVDDICRDIKRKEKSINLLFLTTGTLIAGQGTSEGLHVAASLVLHSRTRFIVNLLPLLQQATAIRRVVSVFTATKEGPINIADMQGWKLALMKQRGHGASSVTLSLETLAKKAPDVSFIHDFPGPVKSGIARGGGGLMMFMKAVYAIIGPMVFIPNEESGERHLFVATSARYPASTGNDTAPGVPLVEGLTVARGTDGVTGSGMYSIDQNGESAGPHVEELLAKFRDEGMAGKVWDHIQEEFMRITGADAV